MAPEPSILAVSVSPHIRSGESVEKIMWTVVACLLPPLILSIFIFGFQTLIITLISVASCVVVEAVSQKLLHRPITIKDGSAVITGLLLAYIIPPGVPYWMPILGSVMAIYVAKHLLGGIGFNFFNPALIGRAFLVATFPVAMTSAWLPPIRHASIFKYMGGGVDAVSTATPLYVLKHYGLGAVIEKFGSISTIYGNFFIGWRPGCIGETSALLLLLGGLFLLYKKYITWHIPVSMIGTIALLTWAFGGERAFGGDPLLAILSGGVIIGAFFMATDYVTSPSQPTAKLIFGVCIGALTVLIRLKGGYPEGVCYAILLMNPLTPAFELWFKPKRFAAQKGALK
ncbi:MAG: RnfABCDGE type electron transport complex subunit D [Deltaproteobacteria bacterium]|nr:RnfABCDGE type electron transport complex subunit D [Deltaproteobacteria bacterium]MBW1918662.1 RnfABCDGE type electron transport complex subunit D [Deltaproteobacteria bacterium]MBW1934683.1 RnfABCDGE type electron transport complex subunit D [Deltaproteobacteria bacterium]MBW1976943.1 RnfABCDGE type electron transport complex subunit D [Deltaproteobacteria bacterium]MBW2043527.1 RnfABCDGE type electron transport complex subunit D [Deltaproteobacteria bacterium]